MEKSAIRRFVLPDSVSISLYRSSANEGVTGMRKDDQAVRAYIPSNAKNIPPFGTAFSR